jgi:hypothetical protein
LTPGHQAMLKVLRDSKPFELTVIVGKRPKPSS